MKSVTQSSTCRVRGGAGLLMPVQTNMNNSGIDGAKGFPALFTPSSPRRFCDVHYVRFQMEILMNQMKAFRVAVLATIIVVGSTPTVAQDSPANRATAADRYLKAVPIEKILDDSFRELSKQLPANNRAQFIEQMKMVVRADFIEKLSRESMIRTFTADELNALADFYGSKNGSSAMLKFGTYMSEVMPAIQQEVQRGLQEIKNTQTRK